MKRILQPNPLQYSLAWVGLLLAGLGVLAGVNTAIDPYWTLPHTIRLNRIQPGMDERLQKSNYLVYNAGSQGFDALLLGSSRGTYLDPDAIPGLNTFNFSANNMTPVEYPEYAAFFAEHAGTPKAIFLAVDFFGTRVPDYYNYRDPAYYLGDIGGWRNRLALLLSFDGFRHSLEIARANLAGTAHGVGYYDRATRMHADPPLTDTACEANRERQVAFYRDAIYGGGYAYNEEVDSALRRLRARFPQTEITVFTTPPSVDLQVEMVRCGRFADYERWLRMLVRTFGSIRDLGGVNAFTTNSGNYRDAHHFTVGAGRDILADITSSNPVIGVEVTTENIDAHIEVRRRELAALAGAGE